MWIPDRPNLYMANGSGVYTQSYYATGTEGTELGCFINDGIKYGQFVYTYFFQHVIHMCFV